MIFLKSLSKHPGWYMKQLIQQKIRNYLLHYLNFVSISTLAPGLYPVLIPMDSFKISGYGSLTTNSSDFRIVLVSAFLFCLLEYIQLLDIMWYMLHV